MLKWLQKGLSQTLACSGAELALWGWNRSFNFQCSVANLVLWSDSRADTMDLSCMTRVSRVCPANQIRNPLCIYSFLYLFNLGLTNLAIVAILTTIGHIHISVLKKNTFIGVSKSSFYCDIDTWALNLRVARMITYKRRSRLQKKAQKQCPHLLISC